MPNRYKKSFLFLVLTLLSVSSLTIFGTNQADAVNQGGNFVVNLVSEPTTLNPYTGAWNNGFVDAQILQSLLTYSDNLSIVPNLAESYSVNVQDGSYIFNLRPNVKWSDGQPFTAQDVKFSFEQIISKYDIFGAFYFANTTVSITNNDQTVIIKPGRFLPGVQLLLFAGLDTAIVPAHLLAGQNFLQSTFINNPVGTGPFVLAQWSRGNFMVLNRNPNYWGSPQPYLDNITIRFINDPSALQAAVTSGQVDYVFRGIPYSAAQSFNQSGVVKVIPSARPPYETAIWFNLNSPYISNPLVRQAIAYALNKTDIAYKATNGISKAIDYTIDPGVVTPSPNIVSYPYNVQRAESLLDQAGYPVQSNGTRFTLQLLERTGAPDEATAGQLIKSYLAQVGINVNIQTVDFATYLQLEAKGQYQMAVTSYWLSPIWTYQLFDSAWIGKGPFTNNFFYNSSTTDSLFNQWLVTSQPSQQVSLLQQIEVQLSKDLPEIPLYADIWINAVNTNFAGSSIPVGKYVFWDSLANVYSLSAQPSQQASSNITYVVVAAVVVVIVVLIAAVALLRRRTRQPLQQQTAPSQ
ncbi:MAG: ABC transporter substrate-binding protein [Conexivisphaerales archaeon]